MHGIGVVLVNYATPPNVLSATLQALSDSTSVGRDDESPLVEVLVLDNASPQHRQEARALANAHNGRPLRVRFLDTGSNLGFAGGVNLGVRLLDSSATLVYLCNPDARVEPDTLARTAAALRNEPAETVAAAPKMLLDLPADLAEAQPVIDGIGIAVNNKGEAFNVGQGQPDIGQYDRPATCFGASFGAAMVRRSAFAPEAVGELDESLFLYYEDVDWGWRSQLLGFDAITVPDARVHHSMSVSMRDRPYGDKFRYTERNLLLSALKNLADPLPVVGRRSLGLLKGSLTGRHYPVPGLRALGGTAVRLPSLLRARSDVQRRRVRSEADVLAYANGERTFFDGVAYRPIDREAALAFARDRRDGLSA